MAILFQDDFNRANEELGVSLNWTTEGVSNSLDVISNEVKRDGVGDGSEVRRRGFVDGIAARADMNVQADIKREVGGISTEGRALIARRVDSSNYYFWRVTDATQGAVFKRVAGVETQLGTTTDTTLDTVYNTYRLEVFGTSIKAFQNGVQRSGNLVDGAITGSGFGGIEVQGINKDSFFDNFGIGDSPGNFLPTNFDNVIPLLIRAMLEIDKAIPLTWDLCKIFENALLGEVRLGEFTLGGRMNCLIRIDQLIPLLIRIQVALNQEIPITISVNVRQFFDHVIALLIRRADTYDHSIPIQWGRVEEWVRQAVAETEAWVAQGAAESDAWTPQVAAEPSAWIPQGGSE